MKQKAEKMRGRSIKILFIAEFLFAALVIITAIRWRQNGRAVVYSFDSASLDAGKGISMETFPYSEFSGIYLDNSLMDDGEKELTVKTSFALAGARCLPGGCRIFHRKQPQFSVSTVREAMAFDGG